MSASRKSPCVRPLRQAQKPTFETLEGRQHFSVVTVTTTANGGAGSLRSAIDAVNAGTDTVIDFNIPKTDHGYDVSDGMWTINLTGELPKITRPVTIDGYTQNGGVGGVVDINGDHIIGSSVVGLNAAGGHTTIRGLDLDNFTTAIELSDTTTGHDSIDGNAFGEYNGTRGMQTAIVVGGPDCEIGVNAKNTMYPTQTGIELQNSSNDTVSNNQIFGGNYGVLVQGHSTNNTISNNTVQANSSTGEGIALKGGASGNTVSGNTLEESNIGVFMDSTSGDNTVAGNSIGDCNTGIEVGSTGNTIGTIGNGNNISNSGSNSLNPGVGGDGIDIFGDSNTIDGNTLLSNDGFGIDLKAAPETDLGPVGCTIQGNTLAGDFAGEIGLFNGAHGNLIGGYSDPAEANVISQSPTVGVYVSLNSYDNAIVGNSISMLPNGVGINTNGTGNNGQAAPKLVVQAGIDSLRVSGSVQSYADTAVRIELFSSPSNNEGTTYIGTVTVMTNASGSATFSGVINGKNYFHSFITATATVSKVDYNFITHRFAFYGGTSEFSNGVYV